MGIITAYGHLGPPQLESLDPHLQGTNPGAADSCSFLAFSATVRAPHDCENAWSLSHQGMWQE